MTVNREIEVKLPVSDVAELVARLRAIGAERVTRVHEQNALFDTPDRQLRRLGSILRIRCERISDARAGSRNKRPGNEASKGLLTFKGPIPGHRDLPSSYKERQEVEFRLRNTARFAGVLRRLGMSVWFQYEKYRTKYRVRGEARLHIDLDETPIGVFLELEGSRRAIDRTAKALGYSKSDYISASYFELYVQECTKRRPKVTKMVFRRKKKH